ncbi:peptidoglycan-binding protein [Pseudoduganella albidiflava]|uniref:tRNA nuclease CdiA C-terminal domain-containing protein n=1 Tax=Pseudoduganella albidiflava TaxID=321983 RepID=A0A411WUP9_9BURK|nr:peptidoglycan-binding protein [Pseudoduganella albidiflava]QBI00444.1 hypothetical protein EYF70_05940 [Pseudoduganella albidiflava]GGY33278.1 hypothetical protein GCM10007387_14450 [Pseudoduganella albidiflava]
MVTIRSIHGIGPSGTSRNTPIPRANSADSRIHVLREGSQGTAVQKLQRQLNARLTPSPRLAVDGQFGPRTHQAVLQYQRGISISADGVAGKQTWYHLLKGDKATLQQEAGTAGQVATGGSPIRPDNPAAAGASNVTLLHIGASDVWEWPLHDKFIQALRRTATKLPGNMRQEFDALLSAANLALMAGILVVWAGSHAFGVGQAVDIVLLVSGAIFLGMAVFDVASELGDFLVKTCTAADERELDEAAAHLAAAIAIMGVAAFIALLGKVARAKGRTGGTAGTPVKPPPSAPAQKPARPAPPPAPQPKAGAGETRLPEEAKTRPQAARKVPRGHTEPTGPLGDQPSGKRTRISADDDAATVRSLEAENRSADILAKAGYKVQQNPVVPGTMKPDYLIEGKRFDCKAPESPRARNVWSEKQKSVKRGQADRIVLNLEDSPIPLETMKQQLSSYPVEGLKEVIVIKGGQVIPFWP